MSPETHHPSCPSGKAEICLVEKEQHHDKYGFLENIFNVVKTDFSGAVSALTAHPPELIILSDSAPYALKTLEGHKKTPGLEGYSPHRIN